MDLDLSILSAVLSKAENFVTARREGVTSALLHGDGIKGWDFIVSHFVEYGEIPSEEYFFSHTGIDLPPPEDVPHVKAVIEDLKERLLWAKSRKTHDKLTEIIEKRETDKIVPLLGSFLSEVHGDGVSGQKIGNMLALGPEVWDLYVRLKNGERGILSPWQAMNDMTLGWWGGDFIVFVARMGVGKTFTMLMLARKAWMDGHTVLFVGTEMGRINLAMRLFSIHFKLPYKDFRRGNLESMLEPRAEESLRLISEQVGLNVVGDDFDTSIDGIVSAVEQVRPDILFVDGLYLVKNDGKDRHSRVSNTADDLKRMAKRMGIPVVASTQFNREVGDNTRAGLSAANVGITDVIGWDCDVMFAQYQTDDMVEDKRMAYRPLKLREGKGEDFYCNWDFDVMNFDQVATASEAEGYVDDYDGIPGEDVSQNWGNEGSDADDEGAIF